MKKNFKKIEGIKVNYKTDIMGRHFTKCPFGKDAFVGACYCEDCKKFLAKNIDKQFVVCKHKEEK